MKRAFGFAAALILAAMPAVAQFDYDDYKPSRLASVVALADDQCTAGKKTMSIVAGKFSFEVQAKWNGEIRPIAPESLYLLVMAERANAISFGKPMNELFKSEVRIEDGPLSYWLPIQDILIEPFKKEVAPGKGVALYVMYIGCTNEKQRTVVMTINEFQAN